ncbi:hypothetical protein [Planctomyces sp. SH-PL62]|uniref:hypothetical protein n=1 Tax=Planctomyces sp. SH-PL62 TaxID=1636152 RepID=UPI00078C36D1|nr:hypothetical protein [Planctomyces sp. SH-PL62]AMV37302.1 hypothetical protein VT85_07705 [Planctomyces sp. SH-PL62]
MRKRPLFCILLAAFWSGAPSVAIAAYSIQINTPQNDELYASLATIAVGGESNWTSWFDSTPSTVRIRVCSHDGSVVPNDYFASSFSSSTGDWLGTAVAPLGTPSGTRAFHIQAGLIANGSSVVATDSVSLTVKATNTGS